MSDLPERLRTMSADDEWNPELLEEAATLIEQLEAQHVLAQFECENCHRHVALPADTPEHACGLFVKIDAGLVRAVESTDKIGEIGECLGTMRKRS